MNPAHSESFALQRVRLLDGPFARSQAVDTQYLLQLDPDRLLSSFLREAGLPAAKPSYGSWENSGLDGHTAGHFLSAAALMYASTSDARLLERLAHMVDVIAACQAHTGTGYVGGIPDGAAFWDEVRAGTAVSDSFSLGGRWVPLYNLHKLFAGLLDAARHAGITRAEHVLLRLAEWWLELARQIDDDSFERMLDTEFGGMNDVFAELAARTGRGDFLAMSRRFTHQALATPLAENRDALTGLHANTQIPKVVGYARLAALENDEALAAAARSFWDIVVGRRSVAIGGNSVREHFHDSDDFTPMILEREGPETCNSYNMLKLSAVLYSQTPDPKYLEYYERTHLNHILSAQHPEHGGLVYFTPMRPRHYRVYSAAEQTFWCCVGTGIESHAKHGAMIYSHRGDDLEVNLFVASKLDWIERGITLRQNTQFPFEDATEISVDVREATSFTLSIRVPAWADGVSAALNGTPLQVDAEGSRIRIERSWSPGDTVRVVLPMRPRLERLPDGSPWGAVVFGPVVLAARAGTFDLGGLIGDDSPMGHVASGSLLPLSATPILDASAFGKGDTQLEATDRTRLRFAARDIDGGRIELEPFFAIHDARYVLYWPVANGGDKVAIEQLLSELDNESLSLDTRTVDRVAFGEQQPESDHAFRGTGTVVGATDEVHWRQTTERLAVTLNDPEHLGRRLRVTWLGSPTPHGFDVFVDGMHAGLFESAGDAGAGDALIVREFPIPHGVAAPTMTIEIAAKDAVPSGRLHDIRLLSEAHT